MSRKRYRNRKKRRQVPVPIASMGDIAFLLIIFFMVLSEVSKDKNLDLDLPEHADVKESEVKIAVRVGMDREGLIYIDGDPVQSAKDVEYFVRDALEDAKGPNERHVQFKCHGSLTKNQFEPVIEAIIEAGGILEAVADKPPDSK